MRQMVVFDIPRICFLGTYKLPLGIAKRLSRKRRGVVPGGGVQVFRNGVCWLCDGGLFLVQVFPHDVAGVDCGCEQGDSG